MVMFSTRVCQTFSAKYQLVNIVGFSHDVGWVATTLLGCCSTKAARHTCLLSHFSYLTLWTILWTVARQAPLSMGFSRQEYWSGLPFLPPGCLPDQGMEPTSLMSPGLAGGFLTSSATWYVSMCLVAQSCPSVILWTVARQAPLSMGFSRQEYWSGSNTNCEVLRKELLILIFRVFCFVFSPYSSH